MIMKAYAIFDSKSKSFMQPWFAMANGAAIRAFADAVNEKGSNLGKHPSDYQLYELGAFDDQTGKLTALSPCLMLGAGSEFVPASIAVGAGMPPEEFGLKRAEEVVASKH